MDLTKILQEYVDTYNDPGSNGDFDIVNSYFKDEFETGDFKGINPHVLESYEDTANDPKAKGNWDLINSKFTKECKFGDKKPKKHVTIDNLLELDKTVDRGLRDKSAAKYLNTFYKDASGITQQYQYEYNFTKKVINIC